MTQHQDAWLEPEADSRGTRALTAAVPPPLGLAWKTPPLLWPREGWIVGRPHAGWLQPVLAADEQVVLSRVDAGWLSLEARDARTGALRWSRRLGWLRAEETERVARPVLAGDHLFVLLVGGDWRLWALLALRWETGAVEWAAGTISPGDIVRQGSGFPIASDRVLVAEERLVFSADGGLHAYGLASRKPVWRRERVTPQGLALYGDAIAAGDATDQGPAVDLYGLDSGELLRRIKFRPDFSVLHLRHDQDFQLRWTRPDLGLFYSNYLGGVMSRAWLFSDREGGISLRFDGCALPGGDSIYAARAGIMRGGKYRSEPLHLVALEAGTARETWTLAEALRPRAITGSVLWCVGPWRAPWFHSSPAAGRLVAVDRHTGRVLWRSASAGYLDCIAGPRGLYAVRRDVQGRGRDGRERFHVFALEPAASPAPRAAPVR